MGDAMDSSVSIPFTNKIWINKEEIKGENPLGRGKSLVRRGTYENREVAVKSIELEKSSTDEFTHHGKLQHKNVLKMLAVEVDKSFRYIVLELCCGSIFDAITNKEYKGSPLRSEKNVMYEIADGLNYIHSKNLVHLDIKPQNILISTNGQIKLADFGSCEKTENGIFITSDEIDGTLSWMAPESCAIKSTTKISVMADIFPCGCVFFFICTRGIHLFGDREDTGMVQSNIRRGKQINKELFETLPKANIIRPMVKHEPENRGSLLQVMENLRVPTIN